MEAIFLGSVSLMCLETRSEVMGGAEALWDRRLQAKRSPHQHSAPGACGQEAPRDSGEGLNWKTTCVTGISVLALGKAARSSDLLPNYISSSGNKRCGTRSMVFWSFLWYFCHFSFLLRTDGAKMCGWHKSQYVADPGTGSLMEERDFVSPAPQQVSQTHTQGFN